MRSTPLLKLLISLPTHITLRIAPVGAVRICEENTYTMNGENASFAQGDENIYSTRAGKSQPIRVRLCTGLQIGTQVRPPCGIRVEDRREMLPVLGYLDEWVTALLSNETCVEHRHADKVRTAYRRHSSRSTN